MMDGQTGVMQCMYADDALLIPHDHLPLSGREAIAAFNADYSASWPSFEYVAMTTHRQWEHDAYVREVMSYSLHWNTLDASGVGIGKGVTVFKRNEAGSLRSYRGIAMHDQ